MSRNPARFERRRISLQVKLVGALLVLLLTPIVVSVYMIDQIGKVAANFGANESAAREQSIDDAIRTYDRLFETTKRLHAEIAQRLGSRPEVAGLDPTAPLPEILATTPDLVAIELRDGGGALVAEAARGLPAEDGTWRTTAVEHPLGGGAVLRLDFAVPAHLQTERNRLHEWRQLSREVKRVRSALPEGYRYAVLAVIAGAVVLATAVGVIAARRVSRRIGVLVAAARKVAAGETAARAALRGRDEMAELAVAFNTMLDGLDRQREQIQYLQRIGAWQDVARSLAHEIKNPLTPIQLAVQQCVSSYQGDDARFARLLRDTGEIVEEEIAGLRRLVDTFRTLGQLPRVEARPLPLREIVEELRLDGAAAERLEVIAPGPPDGDVTVRADKLLLKRVLANLVENGVHAGREAGRAGDVTVGWRVAEDGRAVVIAVDDQGPGVPAAEREHIFEPYVTTKATGTGLGLAIAKKIVLEHGGTLEVAPEPAPTGGARFVVTLPLGA